MKKIIKINGKKMGEVQTRNDLHFEVQKKTRVQIVESKKIYKRARDKKICQNY